MNDDVIPLNEIGKIETVKVYNQSYVNKQQKRIAELEEKISILLSCKNCPDNKGGLICQKEYEDKCLAQKIQYIKELKEENADLEAKYLQATDEGTSFAHLKSLEQENTELKLKLEALEGQTPWKDIKDKSELIKENAKLKETVIKMNNVITKVFSNLTKAKEIIRDFLSVTIDYIDKEDKNYSFIDEAERFLKENE